MHPCPNQDFLLTPEELKKALPLLKKDANVIHSFQHTIKNILEGADPRKLLIVGPCSIHDIEAAKEYALRLKEISQVSSEKFFIVMRVYFEKPRTTSGWKGILYDPSLDGSGKISEGLRLTRKLLLDLASMGIPTAAEFLNPLAVPYFSDLISWGCIGARTVESQIHRQLASSLSMPIGFKNNTEGNIEVAVNAMLTAAVPHSYLGISDSGRLTHLRSQGNKLTHLILRGSDTQTNYDAESIQRAITHLQKGKQPDRIMVDCSHGNSWKQYTRQKGVFESVIQQILEGNSHIIGAMLESNIHAGNQSIPRDLSLLKYGVSLTDSCIDWDTTANLILWGHKQLMRETKNFLYNSFSLIKIDQD